MKGTFRELSHYLGNGNISNRIDCVSIPNNGIPYLNVHIASKFFNSDDIWELITIDNNKQ